MVHKEKLRASTAAGIVVAGFALVVGFNASLSYNPTLGGK
jgi:hypothetical protein